MGLGLQLAVDEGVEKREARVQLDTLGVEERVEDLRPAVDRSAALSGAVATVRLFERPARGIERVRRRTPRTGAGVGPCAPLGDGVSSGAFGETHFLLTSAGDRNTLGDLARGLEVESQA